MPLFLDRLPLYSWVDDSHEPVLRRWSVSLPVLVTDPEQEFSLPAGWPPQRWILDTGYTGEAFAWRSHLLEAGLDPSVGLVGRARTRTAFGTEARLAVREAD